MHAVQYNGYGGGADGLEHVEVPIPTPNKDEVLLKLEAASINPFDWKVQKGMLRPFMPPKFPFIPVIDVAGEVVAVGPGVSGFKEGDKVISMLKVSNGGGLAEYAVASADLTVIRPPKISPAEGAGIPVAALTALQALRTIGARFNGAASDGQPNVLVTAASGGVGLYAVQLARLARLHVTATCGARNVELVRSLGADEVLDYRTPEGSALRSPSGRKYDAVIHCASGIPWSTIASNLSAGGGKVVDINPTAKAVLTSVVQRITFSKKKLAMLFLSPELEELKFAVDLMGQGKLRTVIDSKYPLERAEEAWARSMEGHATGKIIVEMRI